MERPHLEELDRPSELTPGFDQLRAYRLATKLGDLPEQKIAVLHTQIEQKEIDIRDLLDYAGPAGSSRAAQLSAEIRALEAEILVEEEERDAVLRGERLSKKELDRLAKTKIDRSPRSRESGLTL